MPDIDFVPEQYLLCRGIDAPVEFSPVAVGNFVVRGSVRRVLEAVAPEQLEFRPAVDSKTRRKTDWWLAVPKEKVRLQSPKREMPRCPKCGEAQSAHYGTQVDWLDKAKSPVDVDLFKDEQWNSAEGSSAGLAATLAKMGITHVDPPETWTRKEISRHLWMSVRLDALMKKLGVKGLQRVATDDEKPGPQDLEWVEKQMSVLSAAGLLAAARSAGAGGGKGRGAGVKRWFDAYVRKNARKAAPSFDPQAFEKKQKLPPAYKTFVTTVGRKTFRNVDEVEGFDVSILPPDKLDLSENWAAGDEETASPAIRGLMFASTKHGDCFVFDLAAKSRGGDYPVYRYNHETSAYEAYADGFAAAVKRFAGE